MLVSVHVDLIILLLLLSLYHGETNIVPIAYNNNYVFLAASSGFSATSYIVSEDSGIVSICIEVQIANNAPTLVGTYVVTVTGGSAIPGKYVAITLTIIIQIDKCHF